MSGKNLLVAVGGGFVAGILVYLWEVTAGPMIQSTLSGVVGAVAPTTRT